MSGMETVLTDTVKGSMRILSKSAVIENDINNMIAAVKSEMNYQNRGEQYRQSYELQKQSLCLAGDYNTEEG